MEKMLTWIRKKIKYFVRNELEKLSGYSSETIVVVIYLAFVLAVIVFIFVMIRQI